MSPQWALNPSLVNSGSHPSSLNHSCSASTYMNLICTEKGNPFIHSILESTKQCVATNYPLCICCRGYNINKDYIKTLDQQKNKGSFSSLC